MNERRRTVGTAILSGMMGVAGGILFTAGLGESEDRVTRDSRLPIPTDNQQLVLHPDYSKGYASLGYTMLTDLDPEKGDGWDFAEKVHEGLTTGDYSRKLYLKEGKSLGPQSGSADVTYVGSEFFEPYQ